MLSPLIRMTGTGTVALPGRSIDFLLKPKVVGTLRGQGGRFDLTGVTVPVRVKGPWSNPSFRPDFTAAIKGSLPGKLKKALPKKIQRKLPKTLPRLPFGR